MSNFLGLTMSITAAALLAWSSLRSWQAKNNFLKWGAAGLAALLSIAVSLAGVIMIAGLFKLHARSAPASDLKSRRYARTNSARPGDLGWLLQRLPFKNRYAHR